MKKSEYKPMSSIQASTACCSKAYSVSIDMLHPVRWEGENLCSGSRILSFKGAGLSQADKQAIVESAKANGAVRFSLKVS